MVGSSRSLSRVLSGVFVSWSDAQNWETEPSPEIKVLYDEIYAYTTRHNTLSTITGTINDELRATHDEHIKDSGDIQKEVFFLDVLSRLSSVLSRKAVEIWLKTYLRPAIDSAGFDVTFVAKARSFISSLTMEISATYDPALLEVRNSIAVMVMSHIFTIFVGQDKSAYDIMGVSVSGTEKDSQIYAERERFIEKNAGDILRAWGLKNPTEFFTLLHSFQDVPDKRFKTLNLASKVVSSNVSQIQKVLDTPFFLDLLRSLLLDESETVLGCGLGTLLMIMGKICHRVSVYLPELLFIFARLILWNSADANYIKSHCEWEIAESDQNAPIMQTQIFADGNFNLSYLITLLYGLFPSNLLLFCNSPKEYTKQHPPSFLHSETEAIRNCISRNKNAQHVISCKSTVLLSRLLLHPNISGGTTLIEELRNPIRWILSKYTGSDVGEEQVLLECFALNPDIFFDIPEHFILSECLTEKIHSNSSISRDASEVGLTQMIPPAFSPKESSTVTSHRGSFQSSNEVRVIPKSAIDVSHWLNGERRVSLIPSNLILETQNVSQCDISTQTPEKVTFKSVNFDHAKGFDPEKTMESKHGDMTRKDHLNELHTMHEKLFTSSTAVTSSSTIANSHTAQTTSKASMTTASGMLSKQLNRDGNDLIEINESNTSTSGTALDFYQRELLLMKNELEFSSFLKHLHKTKYIKLKLKHNKIVKESAVQRYKSQEKTTHSDEYRRLVESMKELQVSHDVRLAKKIAENESLILQVQTLQKKVDELTSVSEKLNSSLICKEQAMIAMKAGEQESDEKIRHLQHKILQHEQKLKERTNQVNETQENQPGSTIFSSEEETRNADYEVQLKVMKGQNTAFASKLEKAETELERQKRSFKIHLEKVKTEQRHLFVNQAKNYERKIKDLNDIQLKFEQVCTDQCAKIAHLSKVVRSVSIMQPSVHSPSALSQAQNSNSASHTNLSHDSGYDYFPPKKSTTHTRDRHGSCASQSQGSFSSSMLPVSSKEEAHSTSFKGSESSGPASASIVPITKGRGGYQRRSKKFM